MKVLDLLKNKSSCVKCSKVCNVLMIVFVCFIVSIIVLKTVGKSIIEDTIKNNPKIVIDSVENYYREAQKRAREESLKKAPEVAKRLEKTNPVVGNKDGSKVIVEFFDYACGHCRRQAVELNEVIKSNNDVKVVLVDLAIMSQHSLLAAQTGVYISLNNPSKLKSYYSELSKKQINQESVKQVLASIGLPDSYIKLAAKDKKVNEILENNYNAAREIGLQGTPALIINGKFVGGMITAKDILTMLK